MKQSEFRVRVLSLSLSPHPYLKLKIICLTLMEEVSQELTKVAKNLSAILLFYTNIKHQGAGNRREGWQLPLSFLILFNRPSAVFKKGGYKCANTDALG